MLARDNTSLGRKAHDKHAACTTGSSSGAIEKVSLLPISFLARHGLADAPPSYLDLERRRTLPYGVCGSSDVDGIRCLCRSPLMLNSFASPPVTEADGHRARGRRGRGVVERRSRRVGRRTTDSRADVGARRPPRLDAVQIREGLPPTVLPGALSPRPKGVPVHELRGDRRPGGARGAGGVHPEPVLRARVARRPGSARRRARGGAGEGEAGGGGGRDAGGGGAGSGRGAVLRAPPHARRLLPLLLRVRHRGSGWFSVAPTLHNAVPLDGLMCQTVLTKCLGPFSRWERTLRVAKECGYNMIHFTPIQELGASNSSYSIAHQLRVNPAFGADVTFADIENLVTKMRSEWKMGSICDVVLNHTANETPWLAEHPEATYNCGNCPHLRPAALLDAVLARLTGDVARGDLVSRGVPPQVTEHDHIEAIRHVLSTQLIPEMRLHEMYTCNVSDIVQEFYRVARNKVPAPGARAGAEAEAETEELRLTPDPQHRRLHASVDMEAALRLYNVYRTECADEEARLARCGEALRRRLEQLNEAEAERVRAHLRVAVENVCAGMRYERLQADGPRVRDVSPRHPLVPRYFTWPAAAQEAEARSAADAEAALYGGEAVHCAAHNGWVMNADPLLDFAARDQGAAVYLRRELIAWGDSVKLRYGSKPEDSPFLWAHMRSYVELTAELFDGVRLDNCHSTPLHVAEYMLDAARNIRPELYVVAELFTNSDHVDNVFVNRLGITSLVREAQSAWDAHEQGRLVHRYGGRAVGAFLQARRRAARASVAHAMLLDLTHDNEAPVQRRSPLDLLPCAALVAAAAAATGSTRGYDELVPHHVHVVNETRLYREWSASASAAPADGCVARHRGILDAKRALNELHAELARDGYDEVYVDQLDPDVVAVTRHSPETRQSVIVVAFTAFTRSVEARQGGPPALRFDGDLAEVALEMRVTRLEGAAAEPADAAAYVTGLSQYECVVRRALRGEECTALRAVRREGALTVLEFGAFPPGSVLVVRVSPRAPALAALRALRAPVTLRPALRDLDLAELNVLLYRCAAEEAAESGGAGSVYEVPGHGALVYAGLQGVASLLAEVMPRDELAHPLCENLRAGDWLAEYTVSRVERAPGSRLAGVAAQYRAALEPLGALPRYLVPAYFAARTLQLYGEVVREALARLAPPAGSGAGSLWRALALTSVQLTGVVEGASLPAPSPALAPPRPLRSLTLSAGLPHFSEGYMRCWGRDTFIALRGLFLLTGRYQDARMHILGFAACLRHGLIPNLLDGGHKARYNCRDAVWWWIYSIKQYVSEVRGGEALLSEPVSRLFPTDDSEAQPPGAADQPLHDVIQEALDVHFQGLAFRERNASRAIDAHMTDRGFNVQIGIDPETGFPFGGNDANAGTWMDKMGSSEAAGTRGKPATPRDGSAIELVALAYCAASWLARQHRAQRYPYPGVVRRQRDGSLTTWSWAQWAERIRSNFERHFWIPATPSAADARPDLVHRRGIYKDVHGAERPWADYQLRCNFPVAMAVAPDLFEPRRAWQALDAAERLLVGPLGMKTLDPADWAYRPDYDNSNHSADPSVAHGYNYHQGPEWLWPLPFYLRARLAFAHDNDKHARTVARCYAALGPLLRELRTSPWRGLPELTNAGGAPCRDSCPTQAWSSGAALEALHDLRAARRTRPMMPLD